MMDSNFWLNENLKTRPASPFELWNGQFMQPTVQVHGGIKHRPSLTQLQIQAS